MIKSPLKFAAIASALVLSNSVFAVGLGVNTGVGVQANVPGVSLEAGAKADAKADAKTNAGAEAKGKSGAAVKGAKSQGDAMRSDAGQLHSDIKGEAGQRTGQVKSSTEGAVGAAGGVAGNLKGKSKAEADASVQADVKAKGQAKVK
ncbi:MAG TPA: hypothetical protein VFV43_08405 [Limnobacter sp.]|nr:hypothetical protein [Limnobacter sp.]